MSNSEKKTKISKSAAKDALWRSGVLVWLLKPHQKDLYNLFHNTTHKTNTWLLARRSGKTFTLCVLAVETCLKKPGAVVKFLAPTKVQINMILRRIMNDVLESCPSDIKPEFSAKDYTYYFPNGSEIQLAGSESGHVDRLRGGASELAILDESQDITDLENALKSVILPTTLTTKGKVLISGTPPKNPDHDFVKIIEEAELKGSLVRKTIYDNSMLSPAQVEEAELEAGGKESEYFRREYLCHIIKDSKTMVLPEFTPELEKEIVKEWPRPQFYDCYEAMDLGFQDATVVLFAYYDFRAGKVIIEDEYVVSGNDVQIPRLVGAIKEKEAALWTNPLTHEVRKPYLRVSDINYIVMGEISRYSNSEINFIATKKDDKEAAINTLRVMLASKKIIIHPRCQTLIRHLRNVKWDSTGKKFARSPDDSHYDAADAAIYLVRSIIYSRNPYPAHFDMNLRSEDLHIANPTGFNRSRSGIDLNQYYKMLNIRPKR